MIENETTECNLSKKSKVVMLGRELIVQFIEFTYCEPQINCMIDRCVNKSNPFFPALYPSIKIKIVNEAHIETQSK